MAPTICGASNRCSLTVGPGSACELCWRRLGKAGGHRGCPFAHSAHADAGFLPLHRHRALQHSTEARLAQLAHWQALAHDVLATSLNPADAQEIIASQCAGRERRIALFREYLDSVKPFRGDVQ